MTDDAEYQKEYDAARVKLDEEAAKATTSRDDGGRFAKATPAEPEKAEPEAKPEPKADPEPKAEPEKKAEEAAAPDPVKELQVELEKTKKALKDTQSWGTKNAQRLAEIEREAAERKRQAERPAILDLNPDLEQAIKYVRPDPGPDPRAEFERAAQQRAQIIETAHPGILAADADPELVKGVMARLEALGEDAAADPLLVIREITAEKLVQAEREIGKRFAAESAKAAQKNAMTVPGAGSGSVKGTSVDAELEAVNRIKNMSDADFRREVARVKGY